jgi:hypothetical protein
VPKVEDWEGEVDWAHVIIFDDAWASRKSAIPARQRQARDWRHTLYGPQGTH